MYWEMWGLSVWRVAVWRVALWGCLCVMSASLPVQITVKLQSERQGGPHTPHTSLTRDSLCHTRIEHMKSTILDKLHLPDRPSVRRAKQALPQPLQAEWGGLTEEGGAATASRHSYYGETKQVVSFATSVEYCDVSNSSVCFELHNKQNFNPEEIISAKLLIKNTFPDKTVQLYNIKKSQSKPHLVQAIASIDDPWIAVDIKAIFCDEADGVSVFRLVCGECEDFLAAVRRDLPFVELATSEASERSHRSAEQCTDDSTGCCKQSFYVSFKDVGWDDWIVSPGGFWANYCQGSCEGDTPLTPLLTGPPLNTCCSPTSRSPLSVLYISPDGDLIQKDLPDMSVQACGCA